MLTTLEWAGAAPLSTCAQIVDNCVDKLSNHGSYPVGKLREGVKHYKIQRVMIIRRMRNPEYADLPNRMIIRCVATYPAGCAGNHVMNIIQRHFNVSTLSVQCHLFGIGFLAQKQLNFSGKVPTYARLCVVPVLTPRLRSAFNATSR